MKHTLWVLTLLLSAPVFAGSYSTLGEWDKREVKVCFGFGEKYPRLLGTTVVKLHAWSETKKLQVKEWVESEYTPARTGIYFTGFEKCDHSNPSDAVLFYSGGNRFEMMMMGNHQGFALIGNGLRPGDLNGYPSATAYAWFGKTGFDRSTVIHEFGHIARLTHEHERKEALDDPYCQGKMIGKVGFSDSPNFTPFLDYDPESVMSYCALGLTLGSERGLSVGDISLLRILYP